jgi:hypothetical protein
MIVLLASDQSAQSDGGLMVQNIIARRLLRARRCRRADGGVGSRKISVLVWTIAKNRACRRDWAAYSSIIAG